MLRNFSLLTLSNVISQILGILTTIKIAHFVNTKVFGTYNLLQLHVAVFVSLATLGINNIVVKMVARDKLNSYRIFIVSLIIKIPVLLISAIVYAVYYIFFVRAYGEYLFVITIFAIIFTSLYDNVECVAFGLERMEFTSIIGLVTNVLWVIILLSIPGRLYTLNLLFTVYFSMYAIKTLIYFIVLYLRKGFTGDHSNNEWKTRVNEMIKQSLPFYYLTILTIVSNQVPVLFLERRAGVEQVGFFNIANKLLSPMSLILNTALVSLFPNLTRVFVSDKESFIKRVKSIFIIISLIGILGAFAVTFFRTETVMFIYGKKYISSSLVLVYQCWYMCLYSLVCLIGMLLGAIDRQKELSFLAVVCTLFQVPILWFGAKYGAEYLSIAFIASTCLSFILHAFLINRYLLNAVKIWFFVKIVLFLIVAYTISILIPEQLNLILKSCIFIAISLMALLVLRKRFDSVKT